MQQPIFETNFEATELVIWFSWCVSQKLVPEPREEGNCPTNFEIHLLYFLNTEEVYFKSSEFCSSLLIIQAGMLTRSELAGFEVLNTHHNNPLFIINRSSILTIQNWNFTIKAT